jgi:MoxR-like ATPase
LIFITSNSERRLPEPFLRRCVFHHIGFDRQLLEQVVASYADEFSALSDDFVELAINRFLALRRDRLRKLPATGELLVWLRVMALSAGTSPSKMQLLFDNLKDNQKLPPYLGALLKDRQDVETTTHRYSR